MLRKYFNNIFNFVWSWKFYCSLPWLFSCTSVKSLEPNNVMYNYAGYYTEQYIYIAYIISRSYIFRKITMQMSSGLTEK